MSIFASHFSHSRSSVIVLLQSVLYVFRPLNIFPFVEKKIPEKSVTYFRNTWKAQIRFLFESRFRKITRKDSGSRSVFSQYMPHWTVQVEFWHSNRHKNFDRSNTFIYEKLTVCQALSEIFFITCNKILRKVSRPCQKGNIHTMFLISLWFVISAENSYISCRCTVVSFSYLGKS